MAIVVLAVVIFQFDDIREKRSVPLTVCVKNSCGALVENRWTRTYRRYSSGKGQKYDFLGVLQMMTPSVGRRG